MINKPDYEELESKVQYLEKKISECQLFEQQLHHAHKMEALGALASGIANDFNNILFSIIGYAEIALLDASQGNPSPNSLKQILKAGENAKELVLQILAFSRQSEIEKKPIRIDIIISETLKLLKAYLHPNILISEDISRTPPIMADEIQIQQILMSLCTNSGHAMMENGGNLKITLRDIIIDSNHIEFSDIEHGHYVELTVSDTGEGMSSETMAQIFDPFFTTKKIEEGPGLGLSIVHSIVESNNGFIRVYSTPGKGTAFIILFPVIQTDADQVKNQINSIPGGNEHILFIDDDIQFLSVGERILRSMGYKVTTRMSAIEAFELFKTRPEIFDLVITDMAMPDMSGDELVQKLISIRLDIPVILCTGFNNIIRKEKASRVGISAIVTKPFLKKDIAITVRETLDGEIYPARFNNKRGF